MKISIEAKYIAALLVTAPKGIRKHLVSLCISYGMIASTDGARIGMVQIPDDAFLGEAIIPRHLFEHIKPRYSSVEIEIEGNDVSVYQAGIRITGKLIEEKYPDVRRLVPRELSGNTALFSAEYLADLLKIGTYLYPNAKYHAPVIHHNGSAVAIVDFKDNRYFHMLMPVRHVPDEYVIPKWVRQ